ncbi:MAG: Crp/Fnr family transcriptional regulator [Bacteroidales bacterium]|nr:Crp/Fnr family transcriptional regulator [Bacteroidales bacterium]
MSIKNLISSCEKAQIPFHGFDYLKPEEIGLLQKNTRELTFKPGEILCKQGSLASQIIIITKGLAKIYFESPNSNDLILKIISSGTFLGLTTLNGENTFRFSAQCYDQTHAHLIDSTVFQSLTQSNASFASEVIKVLNFDTAMNFERFYSLASKHLHGRMADILICLSNRIHNSHKFRMTLSRSDLGEITNMSTESTIRVLKDFKEDKIIKLSGKNIEILNMDKLKHISQIG